MKTKWLLRLFLMTLCLPVLLTAAETSGLAVVQGHYREDMQKERHNLIQSLSRYLNFVLTG